MKYADALRVLARLEGVPEEEVEAVVGQKFEYVVTCQIYGRLQLSSKPGDRWKAQCIDALRHDFAHNLKVAYVDATRARPGVLTRTGAAEEFSSVLLGVDPLSGDEQVPGSP